MREVGTCHFGPAYSCFLLFVCLFFFARRQNRTERVVMTRFVVSDTSVDGRLPLDDTPTFCFVLFCFIFCFFWGGGCVCASFAIVFQRRRMSVDPQRERERERDTREISSRSISGRRHHDATPRESGEKIPPPHSPPLLCVALERVVIYGRCLVSRRR